MRKVAGFSIIELMIAIVLLAVLLFLGVPAYSIYLNNVKLRSTAESFLAGVQSARSEAIRRNANVDFLLTNDDVSGANMNPTPSSTGGNWMIRTGNLLIESRRREEGSGRSEGSAVPVQVVATSADNVAIAMLTFTGLGEARLAAGVVATFPIAFRFSNPGGGTCAADGGPMRCLNVTVSAGGQARLCDPAAGAGDTRGC